MIASKVSSRPSISGSIRSGSMSKTWARQWSSRSSYSRSAMAGSEPSGVNVIGSDFTPQTPIGRRTPTHRRASARGSPCQHWYGLLEKRLRDEDAEQMCAPWPKAM